MVAEMPVSMGIAKVSTTAEMSNRYRRSLPCHAIDLTLSENMGSSDTRSNDPAKASTDRPITHSVRSAATAAGYCSAIRAREASNDDQKMACEGGRLAGVVVEFGQSEGRPDGYGQDGYRGEDRQREGQRGVWP